VRDMIKTTDTVMLVEDASHNHLQTLEIMEMYGGLVTPGQWMIIEDTILHNGVRNDMFEDVGAFQSVKDFLASPRGCAWTQHRNKERYDGSGGGAPGAFLAHYN
jgi:cephalosporin hydroxylase